VLFAFDEEEWWLAVSIKIVLCQREMVVVHTPELGEIERASGWMGVKVKR